MAAALALFATFSQPSCSDCDGEIIDGECIPPCDDADCPSGAHCFRGACLPTCRTSTDCTGGGTCRGVKTTQGFEGSLCVGGTSAPESVVGKACTKNDDCAPDGGVRCIGGTCTLTCSVHEHCGSSGTCSGSETDTGGVRVSVCQPDDFPRGPGQYGTSCPFGDECAEDFSCLGAGPGDVDAYCSTSCDADADCPTGTYCALLNTAAQPCSDVCGFPGQQGGDCIADDRIGEGREYVCGPISLQRRICRVRTFCNECETNADCRGRANQICARDESGAKICTVLCDPTAGSCPWGNATRCGLWDEELGKNTCSHRFGSCQGAGESCHPCTDQAGCPGGYCDRSQFTGERFCVDYRVTCTCPDGVDTACSGGGCPTTPAPANLEMVCFGGPRFDGTIYQQACVGAVTDRSSEGEPDGCWP